MPVRRPIGAGTGRTAGPTGGEGGGRFPSDGLRGVASLLARAPGARHPWPPRSQPPNPHTNAPSQPEQWWRPRQGQAEGDGRDALAGARRESGGRGSSVKSQECVRRGQDPARSLSSPSLVPQSPDAPSRHTHAAHSPLSLIPRPPCMHKGSTCGAVVLVWGQFFSIGYTHTNSQKQARLERVREGGRGALRGRTSPPSPSPLSSFLSLSLSLSQRVALPPFTPTRPSHTRSKLGPCKRQKKKEKKGSTPLPHRRYGGRPTCCPCHPPPGY